MYQRKTKDVYVLVSNYGYGWEEEVRYETLAEARNDLKAYRNNCPQYEYRITKKRERKECYGT